MTHKVKLFEWRGSYIRYEICGQCFMHSTGYKDYTRANSYCPDYINRKKGNKKETLEEWILKKNKINFNKKKTEHYTLSFFFIIRIILLLYVLG